MKHTFGLNRIKLVCKRLLKLDLQKVAHSLSITMTHVTIGHILCTIKSVLEIGTIACS